MASLECLSLIANCHRAMSGAIVMSRAHFKERHPSFVMSYAKYLNHVSHGVDLKSSIQDYLELSTQNFCELLLLLLFTLSQ